MSLHPPPSQRIAAELRRRIKAGELRPGAPLPSTRTLAREWSVAIATATKALTLLQSEGLIHSRPRARAVVNRRPLAAQSSLVPIGHDPVVRGRIVRAAIALADSEGLDAVTMRSVAARISSAPMSLYKSVSGKDALVLLMVDAVYAEEDLSEAPLGSWRACLQYAARALWRLYRRHPWLAQTHDLTRPLLAPNLIRYAELVLAALDDQGLETEMIFNLHIVLHGVVQGLAVYLERERQAQSMTGKTADEWMHERLPELQALIVSGQAPTFARLVAAGDYHLRLDALFELNLELVLQGMSRIVDQSRSS